MRATRRPRCRRIPIRTGCSHRTPQALMSSTAARSRRGRPILAGTALAFGWGGVSGGKFCGLRGGRTRSRRHGAEAPWVITRFHGGASEFELEWVFDRAPVVMSDDRRGGRLDRVGRPRWILAAGPRARGCPGCCLRLGALRLRHRLEMVIGRLDPHTFSADQLLHPARGVRASVAVTSAVCRGTRLAVEIAMKPGERYQVGGRIVSDVREVPGSFGGPGPCMVRGRAASGIRAWSPPHRPLFRVGALSRIVVPTRCVE